MRSILAIFSFALALVLPAAARAEKTACDLVSRADIERITSAKVGDPIPSDLSFCAGLCESGNGTACTYKIIGEGIGRYISVSIYLPPFMPGNWIGGDHMSNDGYKEIPKDVDFNGAPAVWHFDPRASMLHIFADPRAHILVNQLRKDTNEAALNKAEAIADLAWAGIR